MTREILADIIEDFNPERLVDFFRAKSDDFAEVPEALSQYDDDTFGDFRQLGVIEFPQDIEKLAVVAAKVATGLTERSGKKAQYEKAKKLLREAGDLDAGIFIFYDDSGNFRFSLIYGQAVGTKRSFSNFKRFTYFVSSALTNTTFLKQISAANFSTLEEIKNAFSVEAVNKQFYIEIAKAFNKLAGGKAKLGSRVEEFPRQMSLPSVADDDKKTYQEFAVRLIGRLVFCWFLKKKLSSAGTALIPEAALSRAAVGGSQGYYHSVLEPLFFEVLNKRFDDRRVEYQAGVMNAVPFLNGGLFEAHDKDFYDIDEVTGVSHHINTLAIPDTWFDELFAVFEQYNFTIDENTPVDVELSIDPEMLGRIFENLLAEINPETGETARKSTGSYYTPRPIVEYMVDESLKQYLLTKTGIAAERLANLTSYDVETHDLSESEQEAVLDALDELKIIDPACGSGAFPMGILHKILLILQKIDPSSKKWLDRVLAKVDNPLIKQKLQSEGVDYVRKLGIIQSSIYGVDIQPIAVEISKLRVFLSLIVDESVDDAKPNRGIEPLPNLEFKFVAANSLIGLPKLATQRSLLSDDSSLAELQQLRDKYLTSYGEQKRAIEQEFKTAQHRLFIETTAALLGGSGGNEDLMVKLSQWEPFADEAASWFDPEWMFGVKGGFDIVIANPPYVRHESIKAFKPQLAMEFDGFYCGTADLYTYFYKKGTDLLEKHGHLCFIAPNKFMRAGYGKNTRILLAAELTPKTIIDFCDLPIFDATTYPAVLLVEKRRPEDKDKTFTATFTGKEQLVRVQETVSTIGFKIPVGALKEEGWNLEKPEVLALIEKVRNAGKPLGEYVQGRFYRGILTGLKTGLNEAFVIDAETRKRLIAEDPKSEELIKPWLRGRDIKKWKAEWAGLYVINIPSSVNKKWPWSQENAEQKARAIFMKTYPAIHTHLSKWEGKLIKRDDQGKFWWELRSCAYYEAFEEPKIVYPDIAQSPEFTWDTSRSLLGNTAYIVPTNDKWLLGLLNSKLIWWLYLNISSTIRGGFVRFIAQYMGQVPIPAVSTEQQLQINERVENIMAITKCDDYLQNQAKQAQVKEYERQIDQLVYELYELTEEEIALIEST